MLCKKYFNTNSSIQILFGADLVWKKVGKNTAKIYRYENLYKAETVYEGTLRCQLNE